MISWGNACRCYLQVNVFRFVLQNMFANISRPRSTCFAPSKTTQENAFFLLHVHVCICLVTLWNDQRCADCSEQNTMDKIPFHTSLISMLWEFQTDMCSNVWFVFGAVMRSNVLELFVLPRELLMAMKSVATLRSSDEKTFFWNSSFRTGSPPMAMTFQISLRGQFSTAAGNNMQLVTSDHAAQTWVRALGHSLIMQTKKNQLRAAHCWCNFQRAF